MRWPERENHQNFSSLSTGSTLNIFRTIFRFIEPFLAALSLPIGSKQIPSDFVEEAPEEALQRPRSIFFVALLFEIQTLELQV